MNLSEHFTLDELVHSRSATRLKIDNTPSPEIAQRLAKTAQGLEKVRTLLGGHPILISSGYRCKALNQAVGGSPNSAHLQGWAVDFTCPGYGPPLEIVRAIAVSPIPFDQIINEGTWVHLSFEPSMRRKALSADCAAGKATYREGVA